MQQDMVTFRLKPDKKKALDAIATSLDRDRSYVLNEAIDNYLELHRWQVEHIRQGLREAAAGRFVPEAKVREFFRKARSGK